MMTTSPRRDGQSTWTKGLFGRGEAAAASQFLKSSARADSFPFFDEKPSSAGIPLNWRSRATPIFFRAAAKRTRRGMKLSGSAGHLQHIGLSFSGMFKRYSQAQINELERK